MKDLETLKVEVDQKLVKIGKDACNAMRKYKNGELSADNFKFAMMILNDDVFQLDGMYVYDEETGTDDKFVRAEDVSKYVDLDSTREWFMEMLDETFKGEPNEMLEMSKLCVMGSNSLLINLLGDHFMWENASEFDEV